MTGATDANGNTTTYGYVTPDRLGCITLPGQSSCMIQNSYTLCYENDPNTQQQPLYRSEYVTSQADAAGATYSYNYQFDFGDPPQCTGVISSATTLTVN